MSTLEQKSDSFLSKKAYNGILGGVAMGWSRFSVAPLERLRLQMIVDPLRYDNSSWKCFKSIYKNEGVTGYWRGAGINVIRIVPQGAVAFYAKDWWKQQIGGSRPTTAQLALATCLSGMTCMTAIYPLDLVRGRLTTTPGLYKGLADGLVTITKEEGARALYKGLGPANTWAVPYYGAQFFTYDWLKRFFRDYYGTKNEALPAHISLAAGALAGAAGTTAAFPFERIRRVLQTQGVGGRPREYATVMEAGMGIVRKEGVSALFSGLKANLIKSPIGAAICFLTYEKLQRQ